MVRREGARARWLRAARALLGLTPLFLAAPAHAQPAEVRTFSLAYAVPEGCPARTTFAASILARAADSRETEDQAALAFDVVIRPDGELTRGTLTVRFSHGEHFEREVPASRCADVTTSMAIMAGLLLSGALLPEPAPPPPAPPAPTIAEIPPEVAPTERPPAPAVSSAKAEPAAPVRPWRLRPGAYAHGDFGLGALPIPSVGVSGGLELALLRGALLSPSLRAGVSYLTASASSPLGRAVFTVTAFDLRACPLRVELSARSALAACGLLELGRLRVLARQTTNPLDRTMPFVALGAAARLEAGLDEVFALEAELSAFGLTRHDRFVLQPADTLLYQVPAASAGLSFGVLARLP